MKIFLVDVQNAIEMSHYETFFYENIKKGNISLYERSLDSLYRLDSVLAWLREEINRNPFSIGRALVIFFLPRRLCARNDPATYDIFAQMYIDELLKRHLDKRFRYLCFYMDYADQERSNDSAYRDIDALNKKFTSNVEVLRETFLPPSLPDGDPKETLSTLIKNIPNPVTAAFYRRVFDLITQTELPGQEDMLQKENWYNSLFLGKCRELTAEIKVFRGAYYTDDIAQKIETVLKVVKYICAFADGFEAGKDFDSQISAYMNTRSFGEFTVDMNEIRRVIATYKERLKAWEAPSADTEKKPEVFSFEGKDHSGEFEDQIRQVSTDDLRAALHPSDKELSEFDLQEKVFASLDRVLRDADKKLRAFCEERVEEMRLFLKESVPALIDRAEGIPLTDGESEEECAAADKMNRYLTNELPGYPAELRLRQEVELLGRKIRRIGMYMNAMKPLAFVFTLLFAVLSIGIFYGLLQYSVFDKEQTWGIFGAYVAVFAVLFASAYVLLRNYYKRQIRRYLQECLDLVMDFLQNYIGRAKEFEMNLNAAMAYYCCVDKNNKQTEQRFVHSECEKRIQWHKRKIQKILRNLSFFDAFISQIAPKEEKGLPALKLEDDAVHNEFYQMKIFRG